MYTRYAALLCSIAIAAVLTGCGSPTTNQTIVTGAVQEVTGRDLRIVTGQTVYVPAYSEILLGDDGVMYKLVVTLAIHNTDIDTPIIVQSVRYYDTNGDLVRDYVDAPIELGELATTGFLISARDSSAGWGSNFIVEWVAEEPVSEPIIEAVMVSRSGTQGVSMISIGRVIAQKEAETVEAEATTE